MPVKKNGSIILSSRIETTQEVGISYYTVKSKATYSPNTTILRDFNRLMKAKIQKLEAKICVFSFLPARSKMIPKYKIKFGIILNEMYDKSLNN